MNSGTIIDAAGNAAVITHVAVADNASYLVDTTAPTTLVNSLTKDNVLNFTERDGGVAVSGLSSGAQFGDQVLVLWNGTSHSTTVQADGSWVVGFSHGQLPEGEAEEISPKVWREQLGMPKAKRSE